MMSEHVPGYRSAFEYDSIRELVSHNDVCTKRKMIYVAGPMSKYQGASATKEQTRLLAATAIRVAEQLYDLGWLPFIPHLSILWDELSEARHTWAFWLSYDLEIMKHCEAICRIPGESAGADMEMAFAKKLKLEVVDITDLLLEAEHV